MRVQLVTVFRLVQVFGRRDVGALSCRIQEGGMCMMRKVWRQKQGTHRQGVERICAPFIGNNRGSHHYLWGQTGGEIITAVTVGSYMQWFIWSVKHYRESTESLQHGSGWMHLCLKISLQHWLYYDFLMFVNLSPCFLWQNNDKLQKRSVHLSLSSKLSSFHALQCTCFFFQ